MGVVSGHTAVSYPVDTYVHILLYLQLPHGCSNSCSTGRRYQDAIDRRPFCRRSTKNSGRWLVRSSSCVWAHIAVSSLGDCCDHVGKDAMHTFRLALILTFLGTQPTLTQVPPIALASITATWGQATVTAPMEYHDILIMRTGVRWCGTKGSTW